MSKKYIKANVDSWIGRNMIYDKKYRFVCCGVLGYCDNGEIALAIRDVDGKEHAEKKFKIDKLRFYHGEIGIEKLPSFVESKSSILIRQKGQESMLTQNTCMQGAV